MGVPYLWAYLPAKSVKYLIVGQGLAGTLIGYRLERAGHAVDYHDATHQISASEVAAGIVNPITGRRFVKSWRIDELLPTARSLYGELEAALGCRLWYDLPLVRTLFNRGDENDWAARALDPAYASYLDSRPDLGRIPRLTHPAYAYAGVRQSARVDLDALVGHNRQRLQRAGRFSAGAFAHAELELTADSVRYGDSRYDGVVFCEGWRVRHNPWFAYLPTGGNKGEVLTVTTPERPLLERMLKHRVFLVPRADCSYWVGATSENDWQTEAPSEARKDYLLARLREVLVEPYTVTDHTAAVRPTIRDRRPVIGAHPDHPRLFVFNGLGTKGASLAPLISRWLCDLITEQMPCPAEVSIDRFTRQDYSPPQSIA